jgi:hypothetical protein
LMVKAMKLHSNKIFSPEQNYSILWERQS